MTLTPVQQAAAARRGAFVALPGWRAFRVLGRDALDLLGRLSSNDLAPLGRGDSVTTLFLTPSGRVRHRVLLGRDGDALRAIGEEGSDAFPEWVETYTFAEECRVEPQDLDVAMLLGPEALRVADDARAAGLLPLRRAFGPLESLVVSGARGAPADFARRTSLPELDAAGFLQLRVELGVPASGPELNEERFPLEAGLLAEISFTKGCYTGQEVVARQDTYGKVTRRLAVLAFPTAPQPGEALLGKTTGCAITSVAPEPVSGEHLALGFVPTPDAVPGTPVTTASGLAGRVL